MQLLLAVDWLYTTVIHTLCLGDGFQVAPDGELIRPKVEPVAEEIKYRLFKLDIAEADLHICEAGNITRLQSPGLDLEFCSFHSEDITLGLSLQLQGLTATGLVPDPQEPSRYLKVGLLDLSPVQGDLCLREPMDCVPERQLGFLRKADDQTRRLWFLWRDGDAIWQCGCCGGCLFMQGPLARKPIIARSESAVYRPHFSPLTSVPRHLGLQGLNEKLQVLGVSELECLWVLHRGLLAHYQARYADTAAVHTPLFPPQQDNRSSPPLSAYSDDAPFVSARSSFTSLLAEDYKSCEVPAEVLFISPNTRHKKKPSNLSVDMRAIEEGPDSCDGLHAGYQGVVGSQYLQAATLQIPPHKPPDGHTSLDHTPSVGVGHYKVHHRQSASDTSYMIGGRHTPDASVPCPTPFHVYVPCLTQESAGSLPTLTQKSSTHTLERRRRFNLRPVVSDGEEAAEMAKFSLSMRLSGSNTALLSPPFLSVITG